MTVEAAHFPSAVPSRQKALGAFYTPAPMAAELVRFAVRDAADRVLDPSFGGLVFLEAARDRLLDLGARPSAVATQLYGCDLDEHAHRTATADNRLAVSSESLIHRDFLTLCPGVELDPVEAVVGNPPYIRYQLVGDSAAAGRSLAAAAGVRLTRLASSWAAFVLHSAAFVAEGGRLALVLPAGLLHAQYAGEVLAFVERHFARVGLTVFQERVFPGALEEVVLLFADGRGEGESAGTELVECGRLEDLDVDALAKHLAGRSNAPSNKPGGGKLLAQLLAPEARSLYERLAKAPDVTPLGTQGSVDIGVVTGANDFFLLTDDEEPGLADELLRPAVSKAAHVRGARLGYEDWVALRDRGARCKMFVVDGDTDPRLLATASGYLSRGELQAVPERYKCRVRRPWWALPLPKHGVPDLLLTYCAAEYPRLVLNEANALHTNTLHGVKLSRALSADALAAGFYNSLTMLSCELVGRSYGGGVLKLEPTEAEAVLLPPIPKAAADRLSAVDAAVREGDLNAALDIIDPLVLETGLGLTQAEVCTLRLGAEKLRARRRSRGKPPSAPSA